MKDAAFQRRCAALRLVLSDVDGVLTDGTVFILPDGGEAKGFHVRDGLAVVLARKAGLLTGVLSGRESAAVAHRSTELGVDIVRQGVSDKKAVLAEILASRGLRPEEVAYVGDDLNDLAVMAEVGLSAAPADAPLEVRSQAFLVLDAPGGRGCLRELVEAILKARGVWDGLASLGS